MKKINATKRDALLYTPFHLYSKYHQFPVTVVLHLILILFISINAILISQQYIGFGRANEQTFEAIFLPDQVRDSGLYDVPSTIDLIERTVNNVRISTPRSPPSQRIILLIFSHIN